MTLQTAISAGERFSPRRRMAARQGRRVKRTMHTLARLVPWSLSLLLAGCVPSLYPVYSGDDVVFSPALVGVWTERDSDETWTFTKEGERGYKLVLSGGDGKIGEFTVYLVRVEDKMFLDLLPKKPPLPRYNDFYKSLLLRAHTSLLVSRIMPTLRTQYLEPSWLKRFLQEHPAAIKHERVADGILLTAPPLELQKFFLEQLKTPGAFSEPVEMVRKD